MYVVEGEVLVAMLVGDTLRSASIARSSYPTVAPPRPGCGTKEAAAAPRAAVVGLRLAAGLYGREMVGRLHERDTPTPVLVVTGSDPQAPEAGLRGRPHHAPGQALDRDEFLGRPADPLGGDPAIQVAAPRRRGSSDARVPAGR